ALSRPGRRNNDAMRRSMKRQALSVYLAKHAPRRPLLGIDKASLGGIFDRAPRRGAESAHRATAAAHDPDADQHWKHDHAKGCELGRIERLAIGRSIGDRPRHNFPRRIDTMRPNVEQTAAKLARIVKLMRHLLRAR